MKRRGCSLACLAAGLAAAAGAAEAVFELRRGDASPAADVARCRLWPAGLSGGRLSLVVLDAAGSEVGSEVVWQAPGEPVDIRFDTRGGTRFTARLHDAAAERPSTWRGRAGLLLETRRRQEGPVETLGEVQSLWQRGLPAIGRSEAAIIQLGVHPHGPTHSFCSRYEGWLDIRKAGRYGFATLSDDASFLLVGDRVVASWPGWHGLDGGLHGEHGGSIDLSAGLHRIEYYNVQNDGGFNVTAAWRPPGETRFTVLPASAFRGIAAFEVASGGIQGAEEAAFSWQMEEHATAGEATWVRGGFRALNAPQDGACEWRFDDGLVQTGREVRHLFAQPGLRRVTLEVRRPGAAPVRLTHAVAVRPHWPQRHEFPDEVFSRFRSSWLGMDLAPLAAGDLAAAVLMADAVGDAALLDHFGRWRRSLINAGGQAPHALYRLGFHYQSPSVRAYATVPEVWQSLLKSTAAPPGLAARCQLHLAGFLLHSGSDIAAAAALLDQLAEDRLDEGERRLRQVYAGDLAACRGRTAEAEQAYRDAGGTVAPDDTAYEVRRLARLERSRCYLRAREYEAVETLVREIEWERPLNRMGFDTGLLMIAVHRGRGEAPLALAACRRLLRITPEDPRRAELLAVTAEVCAEQGLAEESAAALEQLFEEHPYSEPAARARDAFQTANSPKTKANGRGPP